MKALILVGGYGTRLRPLTLSVPKPLIKFCNKTIVEHQIEALVEAGVDHVILAVAYQPEAMAQALKHFEDKFKIRITCSREAEPLGTGGPIRLAEDILMTPDDPSSSDSGDVMDESFFVCNSDVICQFPLKEMKIFHAQHNREGTVLVTVAADPSKYGVIVSEEDGRVKQFVEKPQQFVGDQINAGLYLLKKRVISRIALRPTSIEREVFPEMAAESQLYCKRVAGYWADIGQPNDYLTGMKLYLQAFASSNSGSTDTDERSHGLGNSSDASPTRSCTPSDQQFLLSTPINDDASVQVSETSLACGSGIIGNVLIHPTAKIGKSCCIGPNVTIDAGCVIGDGVRMRDCALMEKTRVSNYAYLDHAIIGWKCSVGKWVRIEGLTVLGEDVHIRAECFINGAIVLPHKQIVENCYKIGSIIM